jgi:hypothetical protein
MNMAPSGGTLFALSVGGALRRQNVCSVLPTP